MKRIIPNYYCGEICGNCPELLVRLTGSKIQVGSEMITFASVYYFLILLSCISNAVLILEEMGRLLRDCKEHCNSHMHAAGRELFVCHISYQLNSFQLN